MCWRARRTSALQIHVFMALDYRLSRHIVALLQRAWCMIATTSSRLDDFIDGLSLSPAHRRLLIERRLYSVTRLHDLQSSLSGRRHVSYFDNMTIFASGSYGRLEASNHSDIDLFFLLRAERTELDEFHVPEIRMLSDIISVGDNMHFPKFSNDGEFLKIIFLNEMLKDLGSRTDDYNNHFTARMLLMLESRPIYNSAIYRHCITETISTYFRDYRYHPNDFEPTFLINDILRFWKTLCLNYENRRNQEEERKKVKQKIKNFKLKFSRLLTCFGTIAALAAYKDVLSATEVERICALTPMERIAEVAERVPGAHPSANRALELYCWFLERTALSTEDLEAYSSSKDNKHEAFDYAQRFGDTIFDILRAIDADHPSLRYLVV